MVCKLGDSLTLLLWLSLALALQFISCIYFSHISSSYVSHTPIHTHSHSHPITLSHYTLSLSLSPPHPTPFHTHNTLTSSFLIFSISLSPTTPPPLHTLPPSLSLSPTAPYLSPTTFSLSQGPRPQWGPTLRVGEVTRREGGQTKVEMYGKCESQIMINKTMCKYTCTYTCLYICKYTCAYRHLCC